MKISVFVLILCFLAIAQEFKSIHQEEWEKYKTLKKEISPTDTYDPTIIPLKKQAKLQKKVFGFLPDWEYPEAMNNLKFDLLTHIAAFDFHVNPDGSINNPSGWPWTNLINEAHENGVKVILTAVNFNKDEIHTIITDSTIKQNFFNNLKHKIILYKLDGVNIDFEGLHTYDRGVVINSFMQDLTIFMRENIPGSEVSFDGPAVNWGGYWDFAGLANSCDYIFIMGYAFSGSWSDYSGSTAPLIGGSYNITNTVISQYADVTYQSPEKLILGVPYYGYKWETVNADAHAETTKNLGSTRYRTEKEKFLIYGTLWDSFSSSPWYRYQDGGQWIQSWTDNAQSIEEKFILADNNNLAGVGMWALNYDGNKNDFWEIIRERYAETTNIVAETESSGKFILLGNYPNPFNGQTKIKFYSPENTSGKLIIYNSNGRQIFSQKIEFKAGINSFIWDSINQVALASGLYIYHIKIHTQQGSIQLSDKMLLIK